jgi:hypothetical protein
MRKIDSAQLTKLLVIFALVFTFWNTWLMYPLKLLVVLFHEASHSLAAILTGGRVERIVIDYREGGEAWTAGGWRWLILPAGYLGSMLWGALILLAAKGAKMKRPLALTLGAVVLGITLFYVQSLAGWAVGLFFGFALIGAGLKLSDTLNDIMLSTIGLTSMLYAILDIKDDLISRTVQGSDAAQMSELIPLPPVVWGCLWILIAIAGLALVLRKVLRTDPL